MAALNVTQAGVTTAVQEFDAALSAAVHHEKISCSDGAPLEPLALLGGRFRVGQTALVDHDDDRGLVFESWVYDADVLAVSVGSPLHNVPTRLLLLEDGYSVDQVDYVEVSRLVILARLK
ncbi:TPA: hypothetical protein NEQ81_006490 [Pseudomonas aeruginosa]|uniref:hypothetical protein n=1 Tax=Pseudomonas aeruginosa TaxID=287 RepID=UPI003564AF3A|nr:hypothetical protein [Pseudomonas aeruginosa]HCE0608077.1 hypothetical protein [Pseudomonas aeruginosa]